MASAIIWSILTKHSMESSSPGLALYLAEMLKQNPLSRTTNFQCFPFLYTGTETSGAPYALCFRRNIWTS